MFMSTLIFVSLANARLVVDKPDLQINVPVIVGKPTSPTPEGVYIIEKAYSSYLGSRMLMFRKEGKTVWAIHPNLPSRKKQIDSSAFSDNYLSGGCIGISLNEFEKLWLVKQTIVLQVYGGKVSGK
jgi:L,D-transpeptidase catalytic domain